VIAEVEICAPKSATARNIDENHVRSYNGHVGRDPSEVKETVHPVDAEMNKWCVLPLYPPLPRKHDLLRMTAVIPT